MICVLHEKHDTADEEIGVIPKLRFGGMISGKHEAAVTAE
jgi:hypothetical protein